MRPTDHETRAKNPLYNLLSVVLKKRLDLDLKTSADFRARIIEFPGLWMNEREIGALRADLLKVAARAVPHGDLDYGVFSAREDVLQRTIVTLVYRISDGTPVAFNALPVLSRCRANPSRCCISGS